MNHSLLTYVLRKVYLFKWFQHTWQEQCIILFWPMLLGRHTCTRDSITLGRNLIISFWPMLLGRYTCTSELITLGRNFWIIIFWPMILGRHTGTSDFITLGRNKMYHSILTYAHRQTHVYNWIDITWYELNVSLLSDKWSLAFILVQVIWPHLTGDFLTYAFKQTYLY